MTDSLPNKLKIVAKYDGWLFNDKGECAHPTIVVDEKYSPELIWFDSKMIEEYGRDWSKIIPVWKKVLKQLREAITIGVIERGGHSSIVDIFYTAIDSDSPMLAMETLHRAITTLQEAGIIKT